MSRSSRNDLSFEERLRAVAGRGLERRTELERRLDSAAESLRKESDRRATELSELRDAHQATLEKTLAEQQALRGCLRARSS